MLQYIKKIWQDFNDSGYDIPGVWAKAWKTLDNTSDGFAIKKAIAALFSAVVCVLILRFTDYGNFLTVLPILLGFIMSLLAIRTIEKRHVLKSDEKKAMIGANQNNNTKDATASTD